MSTEYERTRNYIIALVVVGLILVIIRIVGAYTDSGLHGKRPISYETAAGIALMVIFVVALVALIWYWNSKLRK